MSDAAAGPLGDQAEYFAGRVLVMLEHGNFEGARRVIDDAERRAAGIGDWKGPLEEMPLSLLLPNDTRILNTLDEAGYTKVRDVLGASDVQLLELREFGDRSLQIVRAAIVRAREIASGGD